MMIGSLIFIASIVIPSGDSNKTAEKSDKELLQGAWIPVAVAKASSFFRRHMLCGAPKR